MSVIADDRDDPSHRITVAARRLFAERGVAGTRLEDVAQEAGMSRQYLYRFVSGRDEVIELVLTARCQEVGDDLEDRATGAGDDLRGAIADQIVAGIKMGRDDDEVNYLFAALDRNRLTTFLTNSNSPLHGINRRVFGPLFARAIAANVLRTDVTVDAMVVWLQGVMTMLMGRDDLDEEALRETVSNFVLPSLLVPQGFREASRGR
jgi:AcrR family transcriptional regulator